MTKVAFIDLDGVVADADARFAKAEAAKTAFLKDADARFETILHGATSEKKATEIYWSTVFDPQYVILDTLIDGAKEALDTLEQEGYQMVFLTSRPEHMRERTLEWLYQHELEASEDWLVMKPPAFQFTKTVVWKAGTIMQLAAMFGADEVLVIDDEQMNIDELQQYSHPFNLHCRLSLQEPAHDEIDDLPF